MSKMDAITDYHLEDFDVKVQPGVTRESLNHYIRNDGMKISVLYFILGYLPGIKKSDTRKKT